LAARQDDGKRRVVMRAVSGLEIDRVHDTTPQSPLALRIAFM
jgi:hypothetical protein